MRNPVMVLNSLASKSKDEGYTIQRLYRNLYNEEFFLLAYSKLAPNEGNMTEGVDGRTIDGMSIKRINTLIEKLRDQSYQPKPVRRVFIPKANGKQRPLGIPSFEDKLVQEVCRMLLEAIYEGSFSDNSHGFRPNRSCHTALMQVQRNFTGVRWFIEGDIECFFDSIDHHKLVGILRMRIEDEKFINLIWKFLRAGYMENWRFHSTYSGTPQGGIISPILANIYLDQLDKYTLGIKSRFDKGARRKTNPEYKRLEYQIGKLQKQMREHIPEETKKSISERIAKLKDEIRKVSYVDPLDENFKKLFYVRYADDFIIGVIGSKEEAKQIKAEVANFTSERLSLTLSEEKTLITHSSEPARFLGYDIVITRDEHITRDKNGVKKRSGNMKCKLYVPKEKWLNKLLQLNVLKIDDKGEWHSLHRSRLVTLEDIEILHIYNAEIRGLYNYYKLANNASVLSKFFYIMEYSMYKTFANKYRTSVSKILYKYKKDRKFTVEYDVKSGKKFATLYHKGFKRDPKVLIGKIDILPNELPYSGRTSLLQTLEKEECEWCGAINVPLEVHHVRKLKDLKGKARWEQHMIARRRKTMVLCEACHDRLHAGKLD
ncbi:reverse transcriptase/maturase family protein [Shimazuella kribbensis]|uniref:reverse transcriptase/maturase family protein n=1 Tax=Shimazuella kribbensis TaxID=139808 RepID=UPI00041504E9|nr:reverse transcriptase/maturase family protein [Shimazuella kribbensis]